MVREKPWPSKNLTNGAKINPSRTDNATKINMLLNVYSSSKNNILRNNAAKIFLFLLFNNSNILRYRFNSSY